MALFDESDFSTKVTLGQVLRLPAQFIEGSSTANPNLIQQLANVLKEREKNILPVVVQELEEDHYQAVFNLHILDAVKQANLDFVWCVVVDEAMLIQTQLEAGIFETQTPQVNVQPAQVNVLTASQEEIQQILEQIKGNHSDFSKIVPKKVAKAIVDYRQTKKPKNLTFITSLKCGIGKAKIPLLSEFLTIGK